MLLSACADPSARIKATDFGELDTVSYLILSDQLQRVRNVLKQPSLVCVGVIPKFGRISPVSGEVMARLQAEPVSAEIPLEIVSTFECLAHYVRDKGPFTPERSDILAYAKRANDPCGEWSGGMYNQGNLDRAVFYDLVDEDGIARLVGGRECAGRYYYLRR